MAKISIIIPIYNAENYIEDCLISLTNQTLEDIQIILINDGSEDNSLNICRKYEEKDGRIIIINKNNTGASDSRNRGIDIATSEFIAFVDADDWIDYDMFEKMYDKIISTNVDLVLCGYMKENDEVTKQVFINEKEGLYSDINKFQSNFIYSYKKNLPVAPHCKLYRRSLIDNGNKKIRFKKDLTFGEDFIFNLEYLFNSKTLYLMSKECMYHYRISSTSLTSNYRKNWWDNKTRGYKYIKDILIKYNRLDLLYRLNAKHIIYAVTAFANEANHKSFKQAYPELQKVSTDCMFKLYVNKESISILPFKMKVFIQLIKYKQLRLAYFIAKMAKGGI